MVESVESKYKVLIVDDEEDILRGLKVAFSDLFDFISANSGEEALTVLEKEKDIAVVVSDQRMDGVTGVELLARVKDLFPEIVRVLITGYTDLNVAVDAINDGYIYKYIQKPIEEQKTLKILKDALGKYTEDLQVRQAVSETKKKIKERFIEIYESVAQGIAHHVNNGLVPTKTFYDLLPQKLEAFKEGKYDEGYFEEFFNQAVGDLINVQKIIGMFTWVRNCRVEDFQENQIKDLMVLNAHGAQEVIKEREIELETEIASDLPLVVVDRLKTQEMIELLVKNCAKEAPEGSKVRIKAENGTGSLRIKISRTGPAYNKEEIPRLFDPFYKFDKALKDGVSGLDLTNCYIIAAKHGSEIKVDSQSDGETSFSVELPTK